MGFFSDLKDDLSQAVSELKPEETVEENVSAEETNEVVSEEEKKELDDFSSDLDALFSDDVETSEEVPASLDDVEIDEDDLFLMKDEVEPAVETAAEEVAEAVDDKTDEYFIPTTTYFKPEPIVPTPVPTYEPEPVPAPAPAPAPAPVPVVTPSFTPTKIATDEVSVIMESMIINGNMATEGSLDIRGSIVGNVEVLGKLNITGTIQGDSSAAEIFAENAKITGEVKSMGSIKVGQASVIIGNIYATSAVIAGAVKGDIDVKGPVILDASAIVMGNIKSKSVQINNGAVIEGMCNQCYAEVNPTSFFEELKKMK